MLYKIAKRIQATFNAGSEGKLNNFFSKLEKELNRDIKALEQNKKNLEFNHQVAVDELTDRIEDLKEVEASSYLNIREEDIINNAAQTSFMEVYCSRIKEASDNILKAEELLETEKGNYTSEIEKIDVKINKIRLNLSIVAEKIKDKIEETK